MGIFKFFLGNKKHEQQERDELAHQDIVQDLMVKAMAAVAYADGNVDQEEIKRMGAIYNRVTGSHVESSAINRGIQMALESKAPIEQTLMDKAAELEPTDKANIIHAGALIALANDVFDDSEESTLKKVADSMGVGPDSFKRIIDRAKDQHAGK